MRRRPGLCTTFISSIIERLPYSLQRMSVPFFSFIPHTTYIILLAYSSFRHPQQWNEEEYRKLHLDWINKGHRKKRERHFGWEWRGKETCQEEGKWKARQRRGWVSRMTRRRPPNNTDKMKDMNKYWDNKREGGMIHLRMGPPTYTQSLILCRHSKVSEALLTVTGRTAHVIKR